MQLIRVMVVTCTYCNLRHKSFNVDPNLTACVLQALQAKAPQAKPPPAKAPQAKASKIRSQAIDVT